jgi:diphosphomevalonate decarboxylase
MEASTWLMHATMLAAQPALVYLAPATLEIIKTVREQRSSGLPAYFTTDAGPHVKVLTLASHAQQVCDLLQGLSGVNEVLVCRPGPHARIESDAVKGEHA